MNALRQSVLDPDNLPTPADESWKYTNIARAIPEGLVVDIKADETSLSVEMGESHQITYDGEPGKQQKPVLKIHVERGKTMSVIERHEGQGAYWKNMRTEITLEQGATLHHVRVQNDGEESVNTNMVHITLDRDSNYDGFTLNIGGKLTRHEIHAEMQGQNATCSFNGLNLLKGEQHGDTTILIEHQAPHCNSNQFYRTILDDSSRAVFQGKVHVHQIAQKTDGYQLSNTLILSDKAEMDTKPELEIYADDVKCSHGSTTGQLDEEPIFYLRSRGLNEAQARMLMIQAFSAEVIEKIQNEDLVEEISERAETWLQSVL